MSCQIMSILEKQQIETGELYIDILKIINEILSVKLSKLTGKWVDNEKVLVLTHGEIKYSGEWVEDGTTLTTSHSEDKPTNDLGKKFKIGLGFIVLTYCFYRCYKQGPNLQK
jgi:hypothetical protein